MVHQVEAELSSSHWTPSSHLSAGRSLKETEICGDERPGRRETERPGLSARGQARPGGKLTWSPEHRGGVGGELRRGGRQRALLPSLSAPPSRHVTPPSTLSVAQGSVAALPPRRPSSPGPVPPHPPLFPHAPITARARERPPHHPASRSAIGWNLKDASRGRAATIGGPNQPSSRMREHSAV